MVYSLVFFSSLARWTGAYAKGRNFYRYGRKPKLYEGIEIRVSHFNRSTFDFQRNRVGIINTNLKRGTTNHSQPSTPLTFPTPRPQPPNFRAPPLLLSSDFSLLQIPHLRTRRIPIEHPLTIDPTPPPTWVTAFPHFVLAVEIRAGDVEAVDVAWDHACDEEDRVDDCVGSWAGD